jgi:hypothetical protein
MQIIYQKNEINIILIKQYQDAFFNHRFKLLHSLKSDGECFVKCRFSYINFEKNHRYTNFENYLASYSKLITKLL